MPLSSPTSRTRLSKRLEETTSIRIFSSTTEPVEDPQKTLSHDSFLPSCIYLTTACINANTRRTQRHSDRLHWTDANWDGAGR